MAAQHTAPAHNGRLPLYISQFTLFFLAFVAGLALSRLLYEGFFPRLLWLARPIIALPFAAIFAFLVWALWTKFTLHHSRFTIHHSLHFFPLLLNLLWLSNPTVDLVNSRLVFAASVWLTAVLLLNGTRTNTDERKFDKWRGWVLVMVALLPVYGLTMSHSVGAADTFEFQVVTPKLGIVHPTGYPLYLLLGKLFTLLPVGTLAWRLNLASVVYALAAMSLLYLLVYRLVGQQLPAVLGAVVTSLSLTFWSQAIIAEVYALHALIVMAALYLMATISDWQLGHTPRRHGWLPTDRRLHSLTPASRMAANRQPPSPVPVYLLAFTLGLGMTNHVTTIFLLPPALLTLLFAARRPTPHTVYRLRITDYRFWFKTAVAFFLPLLLYAYLPLRWQAVNGEVMGLARFVDWVVAGRFQGALQLRGWLDDPARYQIVGRLFLENWGWWNLAIAAWGLVVLVWRQWQTAVILLLAWCGYTFYALNYYVPDLAVFVIPAQLVVGIWWAVGLAGLWLLFQQGQQRWGWPDVWPLLLTFLLLPSLALAGRHWPENDQSAENPLEQWGRAVLALPLADGAAILADSEKIAPLLYLQVAEGRRPDLDISVWPDEAVYRAQVDGRIAQGQTVYLARYLPGLQGGYHLRAVGPLTEVSKHPLTQLPPDQSPDFQALNFGPLTLRAYALEPVAAVDKEATAVTLYWQAAEPVNEVLHVYVRVTDDAGGVSPPTPGQHPANNFYPTNAWQPDEIVPDYHVLPHLAVTPGTLLTYQIAVGPPFTPPDQLDWQNLTTLAADTTLEQWARPDHLLRAQIGHSLVSGATFPEKIRPLARLPLLLTGFGAEEATFQLRLQPANTTPKIQTGFAPPPSVPPARLWHNELDTDLPPGLYNIFAVYEPAEGCTAVDPNSPCSNLVSSCGWMSPGQTGCVVGQIEISGVALPETAVNFADQIALLDVSTSGPALQPGGVLEVELNWLALAEMAADYTLFLQVVDAQDRIVGQVDSWPVQGTRPTSGWQPGATIADQHTIPLSPEMLPGDYRLLIGWYLLADGRRLPVLDAVGTAVEDRLVIGGLHVE